MSNLKLDFSKTNGAVKPMHAVNNGPSAKSSNPNSWQSGSNMKEYAAAGIPFARTHDASFYPRYGGEHTVDVHAIFRNFDADPEDPASYDFTCTDNYLQTIEAAGTKTFYRLGSKIEHEVKKYGTLVPKDYKKWAVICEHIIRHYTEEWADGFKMDIQYWEIWNEPDLDPDDAEDKRCWSGTRAQFFDFYHVAATHLKEAFPHLKIGGPAIAGKMDWAEAFLAQLKAPLDFFSWHIYAHEVDKIAEKTKRVRELLDKYGFTETESILNEWNYVLGWQGDDLKYSHIVKRTEKGASFTLGTMCACQNVGDLDMLMYYDARPTTWNGLFEMTYIPGKCTTKGYYPFPMFNTLYRLGYSVLPTEIGTGFYATAAKDEKGKNGAIVFTHFNDDDSAPAEELTLEIKGFAEGNGVKLDLYVLDKDHDLELAESITYYGKKFILTKAIPNYTSYLIKMTRL
jgi:hypothetical protein